MSIITDVLKRPEVSLEDYIKFLKYMKMKSNQYWTHALRLLEIEKIRNLIFTWKYIKRFIKNLNR